MDLITHLTRQAAFARATFGPGPRTEGVLKHIESEMEEVRKAIAAGDLDDAVKEWTDIVILGLDGLLRAVRQREELRLKKFQKQGFETGRKYITNDTVAAVAVMNIVEKQAKNEQREYPDWRGMSEDVPIEHDRSVGVQ